MPNSPDVIASTLDPTEQSVALALLDFFHAETTLDETQITLEYDEMPPNLTGNWHLCIIPQGKTVNPSERTNTEVYDRNVSIDLALIRRMQDVPKDRKRNKFVMNSHSLLNAIEQFSMLIDRNYDIVAAANAKLTANSVGVSPIEGFIAPLFLTSPGPVKSIGPGHFESNQGKDVALVARYRYNGMRRVWKKSSLAYFA